MTDPGPHGGPGGNGDEPRKEDEALDGEVLRPGELPQTLQLLKDLSEIEGRRIGIQEGRNQVAMRALEVNENSDKRQFDFHMARLATRERDGERSRALASTVLGFGGTAVVAVIGLILGMAFFGSPDQKETAALLIEKGINALGGGGILLLIAAGLRRLLRTTPPSD